MGMIELLEEARLWEIKKGKLSRKVQKQQKCRGRTEASTRDLKATMEDQAEKSTTPVNYSAVDPDMGKLD